MKFTTPITAFVFLLLAACNAADAPEEATKTEPTANEQMMSPTEQLLARTVATHGGDRYESAAYGFVFRDHAYTFRNDGASYVYTRTTKKDGPVIIDRLDNGQLTRTIDGEPAELSAKDQAKYAESVNSVIYFATLPHKLQDPAVNLLSAGEETVNGQTYDRLRVNFNEEGGGTDHDDNFLYWINRETGRIDFLAYDYKTDGGGVRFRSAYNPRFVGGILFQDYVNYKAAIGSELESLAAAFAAGNLKELSRIETEDVVVLKKR